VALLLCTLVDSTKYILGGILVVAPMIRAENSVSSQLLRIIMLQVFFVTPTSCRHSFVPSTVETGSHYVSDSHSAVEDQFPDVELLTVPRQVSFLSTYTCMYGTRYRIF
jgi:hypothetical protein